jgi:cytochrome c-type biogenesis protein CcmH/NrfG
MRSAVVSLSARLDLWRPTWTGFLSVELVNVEVRRAPQANPDAVDLTMRGWSILNGGPGQDDVKRSVAVFEDALRIDPDNSQPWLDSLRPFLALSRRFDAALATYDRAIALDPNHAAAYVSRSRP